ncbi:MAG: acetylornithine transaminase [Candidatus Omnitrophica bacterium]|nr:acetylornithine transaminase [Candidatus Omnitrophota bacterium]
MTEAEVLQTYQKYVVPSYRRTNLCLVKGNGAWVTDTRGKRYLDFFPGWAVSGIGHCHPRVVKAIAEQAKKSIHFSNNFLHPLQAQLAEKLIRLSFPGKIFFANSGAEANEAAIKLARLAGRPNGRYQIISFTGSFHGRTLATLTMTGQHKVQKGFSPLPSGFRKAKFNDLESVKKVLGPKTAAIVIEPIQGEGGVNPARPGFLKDLRRLCTQHKILLIFDEIQTGMGRTGKLFAFQHYQVTPDAMTLAKTLGGGVPIGAIIIAEKYADLFSPGTHASTFGGGPLVCAAALAVLEAIEKEKLLENAVSMGAYLQERLRKISPLVKEVRGAGLMIGCELKVPAAAITEEAQKNGLLVNCTQYNVLRVMPPLTLTREQADLGLSILKKCLN